MRHEYTKDQRERIVYAKKSIWNDVSKIVIFSFLFTIMGFGKEFGAVFISFVSTRIWMGGIHKQTYLSCFVDSFCWLLLGVLLADSFERIEPAWFGGISILLLSMLKPVQSPYKKEMTAEVLRKRKLRGIITSVMFLLCALLPCFSQRIQMAFMSGQLVETLQVTIKNLEGRKLKWIE